MTASKKLPLFLGLGFSLAGAGPALADQDVLTPTLALKEEFTDNLLFSTQDKQEDWITTVSPGLRLAKVTDRLNSSLNARLDASRYSRNQDLNALDQFLQGKVAYQTTQLLNLAVDGRYSKDSRVDRDLSSTGLIVGTSSRQQQKYGLSSNYTLSETTAALLSYSYEKNDLDNPLLVSYLGHNLNGGLSRDFSRYSFNTVGFFNLYYSSYQFSGVDEALYRAMVGAQKELTEKWQLHAEVGPNLTHMEYLTIDHTSDEWGTVGSLNLTYTGETTKGALGLSQEEGTGASDITGTTSRTSFTFSAERKITEDLNAKFTSSYTINQTSRAQFVGQDLDRRTVNLLPRLSYQLTRDLSVEGAYSYDAVEDKINGSSSNRNLFTLRLVGQKPLWD